MQMTEKISITTIQIKRLYAGWVAGSIQVLQTENCSQKVIKIKARFYLFLEINGNALQLLLARMSQKKDCSHLKQYNSKVT